MKKVLLVVLVAVTIFSCNNEKKKNLEMKTNMDSVAYSIGADIGRSFEQSKLQDINLDLVQQGIQDFFNKDTTKMSKADMQKVMMAFSNKRRVEAEKERKEAEAKKAEADKVTYKANIEEGEKFLAENAKKAGVVTTASGLQYKVIKAGKGNSPKPTDRVKVHYKGTLINGKEFDSSYGKEPAVFGVTQVIPGWTEVLQLMKPGAKYEVYIPQNLAYGARGAGADITPYSTLIFEVELLSIEK